MPSLIAALCVPAWSFAQEHQPKLYRWVDKDGGVHIGDSIPPEYADRDREVINGQGVAVDFQEGEVTEEERAALARAQAKAEAERRIQSDIARRDRMLLETYLSIEEIEDLRDRRLELLESQIKVTELYLTNLRKRLVNLQREATAFKPYSERRDAPQIPENLSLDMSRTMSSINVYEQTLARTRIDQEVLKESFAKDIERFQELKGG